MEEVQLEEVEVEVEVEWVEIVQEQVQEEIAFVLVVGQESPIK